MFQFFCGMAVFKKLRKNKDKSLPLPEPEAVKPLDKRVGIESYREFFTLKNWWKTVDRKRVEAATYMFSNHPSIHPLVPIRPALPPPKTMGSGASKSTASAEKAKPPEPAGGGGGQQPAAETPTLDTRLPYPNFRELFTMKNYWKTVRRNEKDCGKFMFAKYLNDFPENKDMYLKLKNVKADVDMNCSDPGFEAVAAQYLKVFDDVINAVEEKPGDVQTACDRLISVGKMHRAKVSGMTSTSFQNMEEPFIQMVKYILQDRFNEKAETLYRKFFQFCLTSGPTICWPGPGFGKSGNLRLALRLGTTFDFVTPQIRCHHFKCSKFRLNGKFLVGYSSRHQSAAVLFCSVQSMVGSRVAKKTDHPEMFSRLVDGPERIRESVQVSTPITGCPDGITKTVWDVLTRSAQLNPDAPLFGECIDGEHVFTTYRDAVNEATIIGSGIIATMHKLDSANKLIGIAGVHSRNYMHTMHAISGFDLTVVPLYHQNKLETLCDIIDNCKLEIIFCENTSRAEGFLSSKSGDRLRSVKTLIILEKTTSLPSHHECDVLSFDEFHRLGSEKRRDPIKPKPATIYVICHTSGTTGRPKGVEMSHGALLACVAGIFTSWTIAYKWKFGQEDAYFSFLSLAHIYEHLMQTLMLYFGARIGIYNGSVATLVPQIQKLQPTIVSLVPRLLNKLYEGVHNEIATKNIVVRFLFEHAKKTKAKQLEQGVLRYDTFFDKIVFKKLKLKLGGKLKVLTTGGAPVTKEVKTFTRYAYGCPLVEGYGQTECSAAGTLTLPWDTTYGNVGGPAPWSQVKLVDVPEKNYLAQNDEGEVCFRGAALMSGYFQDPELTKKTIDEEGWLHTGDIGKWLPTGALQIIDRKNEMFKLCQGDFVSPIQIEAIYANSPLITQIYVTGSTERSFLVGIVVLDLSRFKQLPIVKALEANDPIEKIMTKKEARDAVLVELNKYAKENGLQTIELIRNVHLTSQEFSEENGLVTSTLKNRRKILEDYFAEETAKLYKEINTL
ncbi:unnamed protein product [Caenorhabditis sp. 36 PRJEB53466]|nr:unnamed protein product [Caenorhabditis sp. 36 PRJEB53466]